MRANTRITGGMQAARWQGSFIGRAGARGFSLVELLTVLALVGLTASIALPKLRQSPAQKVRSVALDLMYELEASRVTAMATQKKVRLTFDEEEVSTQGYLDVDADGVITGSVVEQVAFNKHGRGKWRSSKGKKRGKKGEAMPEVAFGRGAAPPLPIDSVRSGSVTLPGGHVELSKRGVTDPFGASGAIYLYHTGQPEAVAAISISGAASLRIWSYRGGAWR